jgi:hypothetical protein
LSLVRSVAILALIFCSLSCSAAAQGNPWTNTLSSIKLGMITDGACMQLVLTVAVIQGLHRRRCPVDQWTRQLQSFSLHRHRRCRRCRPLRHTARPCSSRLTHETLHLIHSIYWCVHQRWCYVIRK